MEPWTCNPELKSQWESLRSDSFKSVRRNVSPNLWFNYWLCKSSTISTDLEHHQDLSDSDEFHPTDNNISNLKTVIESSVGKENESKLKPYEDLKLTPVQLRHINSLALELVDIFETGCTSLSNELLEDLNSLPISEKKWLLKEIQPQLSDQGAYTLCTYLCNSNDKDCWVDIRSVLELVLSPMILSNPAKSAGAELAAGIIRLCCRFPSICVSQLLKPILINESAAMAQSELVSRVVPSLPHSDFLLLLREFIGYCSGPLAEWELSVLNTLLSGIEPDVSSSAVEYAMLDLLPVLSASARPLATSESFGCLLLKVISCLKSGITQKICTELRAIAHESSSFNKRAIINALKTLQP